MQKSSAQLDLLQEMVNFMDRNTKDMFTIISKFYLNSELKYEALHAYMQGYDAVRLDQMKHYWDLCRKRRE